MLLWMFLYKFCVDIVFNFLGCISRIAGSYSYSILSLLRNYETVFQSYSINFTFPSVMQEGSRFSTSSAALIIACLFCFNLSSGCDVVSHGFDLHFPDGWWCWASFHVLLGHLYIFFGEIPSQVLFPFLNWFCCSVLWGRVMISILQMRKQILRDVNLVEVIQWVLLTSLTDSDLYALSDTVLPTEDSW